MANVAYYFGFSPIPDEKGSILTSEGLLAAANTVAIYLNSPLTGTLALTTAGGFSADTTAGLGAAIAFKDNVTFEIFQYRPAAAQTNAWHTTIADPRNDFKVAADGATTPGETYAIDASTDDGGSTVTFVSTARVDASNTHASANTIESLGIDSREVSNTAGVAERIKCRFAQRGIY